MIIPTNRRSTSTTSFSTMPLKPLFENRIQLSAPRTSGLSDDRFSHEGIILKLHVDDNNAGFGEVCLLTLFAISTVSLV